jgi:hypothetical protein
LFAFLKILLSFLRFSWVSQQGLKFLVISANETIGTKKLACEAASQDGSPETTKTLRLP